jgi:uncharacterized iron-regulated protein
MKITLLFGALLIAAISFGQDKPAYKIYDANGKAVSYKKMLKSLSTSDITLFGELHNNAIAHWLQLEVTKDLHKKRKLKLGAEMIEADNQDELNDYLAGTIDAKTFDSVARLWMNHETDYAPLVNFAKDNSLDFIACNIPRRYAVMVHKKGFGALDTLTAEDKSWIAPLPILFDSELPTYKNILEMMGEHGTPELVMAQAIKDATMAYFILKNFEEGNLFIHYNGAFHSNHYEGIGWYLKQASPEKQLKTISTVEQENVNKLEKEYKGIADFIICVDVDMTTTY